MYTWPYKYVFTIFNMSLNLNVNIMINYIIGVVDYQKILVRYNLSRLKSVFPTQL